MNTIWARSPEIVVFTGGGAGARSRVRAVRPGGDAGGLRLEDVVTSDGFARDPAGATIFTTGGGAN